MDKSLRRYNGIGVGWYMCFPYGHYDEVVPNFEGIKSVYTVH